MPAAPRSSRRCVLTTAAVALGISMTACGGGDADRGADGSSASTSVAGTGLGDAAATTAAPRTDGSGRTIVHRFGETVVPADPQRIVTIGTSDADTLAVLGIEPVGAYPNDGFGDGRFYDWLDDRPEMADTEPLVRGSDGSFSAEQIAALRPDLIIMVNAYLDPEALYEAVSPIAPTVASSVDPSELSWQELAVEVARAVGRETDIERRITEIETSIRAVADDNPSFAGATLTFGGVFDPAAPTVVYGDDDYSRQFLAQLGFSVPPAQAAELPALAADPSSTQADLSLERLDLLDADVIVLGYLDSAVREQFEAETLFRQVPAVADGRYIDVDASLVAALRLPSVLAVPYVLDVLTPQLRTALV